MTEQLTDVDLPPDYTDADGRHIRHYVIASAERYKTSWTISTAAGDTFGLTDERNPRGLIPQSGDPVALHTLQYSRIVGLGLRGWQVFRLTPAEVEAEHQAWLDRINAEKREWYEQHKDNLHARVAALPEPLRERIARFTRNGQDFLVQHLGYELAACETAVAIAALGSVEAVEEWKGLPYAEQETRVKLDGDLSGNQVDFAAMLAKVLLTRPRTAPYVHGAITPITGCEEVGCHPIRPEEQADVDAVVAAYTPENDREGGR